MGNVTTSAVVGTTGKMLMVDVHTALSRNTSMVAIEELSSGYPVRMRSVDTDHVRVLAGTIDEHMPIVVHRPTMRVIDGVHRLCAATIAGQRYVAVDYFDGSEADAFLLAVRLNVWHGLPLTLAERKNAALRILQTHSHWSDRALARSTGLSGKTVARLRNETSAEFAQSATRLGRDGRTRPASSEQARKTAVAALMANPDASLRELARKAGVSVGTIRDVRDRLLRGEDPVARKRRVTVSRAVIGGVSTKARLAKLARDPSLRATEPGRRLLRMLMVTQLEMSDWERLIAAIPAHCVPLANGIIRGRIEEWQALAAMVARRARDEVSETARRRTGPRS